MGEYTPAAICPRGHVITTNAYITELVTPKCRTCGATVLIACPACGKQIRGNYHVEGVVSLSRKYKKPDFCADCGVAFPWASRDARIYELMNLLDEEDLAPAEALKVREQLEALTDPELDEQDQEGRWSNIKRLAPNLWAKSGAQQIITTLVLAEARVRLGLPPS